MDIGIIGSGNIGGLLARKLAALGHQVTLANSRGPGSLAEFVAGTGIHAATVEQAARAGDIVIVSIPEKAVPQLPRDLFAGTPERTIIVDTGNYYPGVRDDRIDEIEAGMPDSEWVARQLGRPVIKAFNNIMASSLARRGMPTGASGRICLAVAGDSAKAKAVIVQLLDQLGFDGLDAGTLAESWRQQPGTPAYCQDLDAAALRAALAAADESRVPEYRASAIERVRALIASGRLAALIAP